MLSKSLFDLARPGCRQRQDFLVMEDGRLTAWAEEHRLTLREAYRQVLAAGIFPESLERNFPTLSGEEQLRLFDSRVLIVGLGGLGGYQAQLLARMGVGRLWLADGDRFTVSNLNRQLMATRETLGKLKTRVTAEFLRGIHPAVEIHLSETYLDSADYQAILPEVDLALDGLDSLPGRKQLLTAAREAGKPVIHGAVLGDDGRLTTVLPDDQPVFAAAYLNQPGAAGPPPVTAPSVALVAGLQVQEAIRLLLNHPLAYHGTLAHLDGSTGQLHFFPLW